MILLSKVFPTLDCASCISTPKMAATINHPNIETLIYIENLGFLQKNNFDAALLSVGLTGGRKLSIPGEDLPFVRDAIAFLQECNGAARPDLTGKTVAVIGGGNVAIDCARSAVRLGAHAVTMVCLECPAEMPAHGWEIQQAEEEGVYVITSWSPRSITGDGSTPAQLQVIRCSSVFDAEGRFNPVCDESIQKSIEADIFILAIGLLPDTQPFENDLALKANGILQVEEKTLQTSVPNVFACGDAVTGPKLCAMRWFGEMKYSPSSKRDQKPSLN